MKFFRLDLLTLLISLFILNSCKNEGTIGLGVKLNGSLVDTANGGLIDTATVVINTVPDKGYYEPGTKPDDSISTTGLTKTPMGYFQDPVLGTVQSDIAAGLNLPGGGAYTLPSGTVIIDSAVLALRYVNGFYGDSLTSKYKVNVYQSQYRPINGQAYYNTTSWGDYSNATILGTRTFYARTHDSVKITNIIAGKPDTIIKVAPQLRIPIDPGFIYNILFNAPAAQLASNTVFVNKVKGLYISIDKAGTQGPGGIFMFNPSDSLNVYYHAKNGTSVDTAMISLPLVSNSSTPAARIIRTPSPAVKAELANAKTGTRNVVYLQGLAGLRARIKFPYLKNIAQKLKAQGKGIVVNKAEVVITPVPGTGIPYWPQSKLTMYRNDITNTPIELQDASATDPRANNTFGGVFNAGNQTYHFNVTAYVQDMIDGKTPDYGTYIATVDPLSTNTTAVDYLPTVETAGRTIAIGSITDPSSPYYSSRIKLNIIYTKIKQ